MTKFSRYALALVGYTVLVILWGAWVRISHSGAGCGEHWPLCNGELLPGTHIPATLIEFSHRLSTGLYGILVVILVFLARKQSPRNPAVVRAAWATAAFTVLEAWIGARLVLSGWVAQDTSLARAFFMALHQVNSMFLSGSVFLVWFLSLDPQPSRPIGVRRFLRSPRVGLVLLLFAFLLCISMSGAIASLAGTLFPSESLMQGLEKDFAAEAHPVLRYRIWHPLLALSLALTLIGLFSPFSLPQYAGPGVQYKRTVRYFLGCLASTVAFGSLTLLLLSPVWMKLTHLGLAHLTWFSALAMSVEIARAWSSRR